MRNYLLVLVMIGAMVGCNKPAESLSSRLQKSDRIEIEYFRPDGAPVSPIVVISRAEIDALSKLVTEEAYEVKGVCKFQGKISFKKADSLIFYGDFEHKGCNYIAFTSEKGVEQRKLDPSAIALLQKLEPALETSILDNLNWFLGRWKQVEGPDLVSYEDWKRVSPTLYTGMSWTMYQLDTVHVETIELKLEGEDIYYIPTVPENDGPVRFKMTNLVAKSVMFENPEHDFPQKISYEAKGDTMLLAKISGSKGGGKEVTKEFPLHRATR